MKTGVLDSTGIEISTGDLLDFQSSSFAKDELGLYRVSEKDGVPVMFNKEYEIALHEVFSSEITIVKLVHDWFPSDM